MHPSKVLKVHAIPTSFQVSPFPCSTALAGSGEPTGRRLGGIACAEPFAYVLGVAALGNRRARELLLAVVADLAYPKTLCHRWQPDFCAVRGWKTRLSVLQVGSPLPVWVKAHSQYKYIYIIYIYIIYILYIIYIYYINK